MELKTIYIFSFFATIVGAVLKIMHWPFSSILLGIGITSLFVFVILAVNEILKTRKIENTEKIMWIIGLLFFGLLAGFLYVNSSRKRILRN